MTQVRFEMRMSGAPVNRISRPQFRADFLRKVRTAMERVTEDRFLTHLRFLMVADPQNRYGAASTKHNFTGQLYDKIKFRSRTDAKSVQVTWGIFGPAYAGRFELGNEPHPVDIDLLYKWALTKHLPSLQQHKQVVKGTSQAPRAIWRLKRVLETKGAQPTMVVTRTMQDNAAGFLPDFVEEFAKLP